LIIKKDNTLFYLILKTLDVKEEPHPDEISEFYRDEEYLEAAEEENLKNYESENIRNNIINLTREEHQNNNPTNTYSNTNQGLNENDYLKAKKKIQYEEPVSRNTNNSNFNAKEKINRLNPIDFVVYNKIESTNDFNFHHYTENNNSGFNDQNNNYENLKNTQYNNFMNKNTKNDFKKTNTDQNQSYFSTNNFKNTGNPFITNNLVSTKFSYNKNQFNKNNNNFNENNVNDSVVGKIIRAKEPEIKVNFSEKTDKIKNANSLVEEFMKDIIKVYLIII